MEWRGAVSRRVAILRGGAVLRRVVRSSDTYEGSDLERCEGVLRRVDACAPVLQQSAGVFENGTRICSGSE